MRADVFPRRNLPGESEQWGRALEDRIRSTAYDVVNVGESISSDNRVFAGQAGAINGQIDELRSRVTNTVEVGTLTTSVPLPANFDIVTAQSSHVVTVPPPADGKPRKALVLLTGIAVNLDPSNVGGYGSNAEVKVRINGIVSTSLAAPVFTSVPPGYLQTFSLAANLSGVTSFVVDVFVIATQAMTPVARTIQVGITECVATVVYQEKL